MIFRFAVVAVMLASPATAFVFSESDQRAYCATVAGPENFDIWQCIDKNRDEFRRAQIIFDSASSKLASSAIESCERKYYLDWSAIRRCSEDQQVAALRVSRELKNRNSIRMRAIESCFGKYWPDATLIAPCIPQTERTLLSHP